MLKTAYEKVGLPTAFSGRNNLQRELRLKRKAVEKSLESIDTYTTKREAKKPKHYNPYYVWEKRKLIQIDLIDYSSPKLKGIVRANYGFKYLFCAIDTFTRYAWVLPMKDKRDKTCVEVFNRLLEQMGELPQRILSDSGLEFKSKLFRENLERRGILPIYANFKAGTVERFQRSLQSLVTKYQRHRGTQRFIKELPDLLTSYNSRYHRIIKMSPQEAERNENRFKVRANLRAYYNKSKTKKPRYAIGDKVRVQKQQGKFGRGYDDTFTREIFNISEVNESLPVPMYTLTSFDGETQVRARFYGNELQKVSGEPFEIKTIIKKEKAVDGTIRYFAQVRINNENLFAWVKSADIHHDFGGA